MKKFFPLVLMILILSTGCGNNNDAEIKVGTIKYLNVTEEALDNLNPNSNHKHIIFNNLSNMAMALQSRQIDEMSVYESVAQYISARNGNIIEWNSVKPKLVDVFCCAMREDNVELKKEFDAAILELHKDGTLSRLVKTYLNDSTHTETPPAIELPHFYNDTMIKVGVTGDLPMLDYIRPDGMPAGFNTAVLAEISKRLEKNFVLVQIESGSRALALTSGEVDVIFWAAVPSKESHIPKDFDKLEGMILTEPYFSDEIVHVKLR